MRMRQLAPFLHVSPQIDEADFGILAAQGFRSMAAVMPACVRWIRAAAGSEREHMQVVLEDGERLAYRTLVVAPGIELDWDGIEGLRATLGRNGVTSNYLFEMAPYTWELVQAFRDGTALFTQPPMPIKCAGAPQKAMYLACDRWLRSGRLPNIDVEFQTARAVLFGVKDYVPALMGYVRGYETKLGFNSNLKAVDGDAKKAWFNIKVADGSTAVHERSFDLLHVCPPQRAPAFVRNSPLADASGWIEVSAGTLQHPRFGNVSGLGDAGSAPNAKTAAAASIYFDLMLKGHEWLARPKLLPHTPGSHETQAAGDFGPERKKAA